MTTLVLVYEEDVLRLICQYVLQSERRLKEEQAVYDDLKNERDMHSVDDLVV